MEKEYMNVVVMGHFRSGKSTTAGHTIYKCGGIDERTFNKIEKKAEERGKAMCKYAWVFDHKYDLSFKCFETPKYNINIIDAPSLSNYIPNTIAAISQANCAILLVSATEEFEEEILFEGQTQEHALLAFFYNVKNLIIAVNKMDSTKPPYSEVRFNEIKEMTSSIIVEVGYNPANVAFVPISGWLGENLVEPSVKMPWFRGWSTDGGTPDKANGTSLIEAIDGIIAPTRPIEKPLHLLMQNLYLLEDTGVATGPVVSKAKPCISDEPMDHEAFSEENVGFGTKQITTKTLHRDLVGDYKNSIPLATDSFLAEVTVLREPGQICLGDTLRIYYHAGCFVCRLEQIQLKWNPIIDVSYKNPTALTSNDTAVVRLNPTRLVHLETLNDYPSLGRFIIRNFNRTIGTGTVLKRKS